MSIEYEVKHHGTFSVDDEHIRKLVGDVLGTLDFMVQQTESDKLAVSISGTDVSRIAFSKLIQHMCTISDSIVVSESHE